jgi:hypothetical protein
MRWLKWRPALAAAAFLLCLPDLAAQSFSFDLNVQYKTVGLNFQTNEVFIIDRRKDYLLGAIDEAFTKENVEIRIAPTNDWDDKSFTKYELNRFFKKDGKNYIQVIGKKIPDNYFLLVKVKPANVDDISPFAFQAKESTSVSDMKSIFTSNQLSLGASFSFALTGPEDYKISPLFYYQFRWIYEGTDWYYHLLPCSAGIILNPSLSDLKDPNTALLSLLTFGLGVGLLDNLIIAGIAYDIPKDVAFLVFAVNL